MKKIALFGATGQTGINFLEQALSKGYSVKALVRNKNKVKTSHQNLEVIEGDILDYQYVKKTIECCDIVISLFGHVKNSPKWLQTDGTKLIVQAMKELNIERVISLSGGGVPYLEFDQPKFADRTIRFIMKTFVPTILNDAIEHHKVLAKSGLKWTIVRGPMLTNDPKKGKYRVGWVGVNASTKIGRADLADFIVTLIDEEKYLRQLPFVSY